MNQKQNRPLVLVTGSTGLIGSKIQKKLSDHYQVIGLDIVKPKKAINDTFFYRCDLTSDKSVAKTLEKIRNKFGKKIASVIHLAAYYDFSGADSPLYEKLTVRGSERLIKQLQDFDVEQFIFSSTHLVMKPATSTDQKITEDSALEAKWDYPQSKIQAERALLENHGEIPLVLLRIAGAYDENGHSPPICNQIKRIYEKSVESILYPGEKEFGQPFIHLDDIVDIFVQTVKRRQGLDKVETFFAAEPTLMSYEAMQKEIGLLIHQKEWPTLPIPKSVAKLGAFFKDILPGEETFIKPWMVDLTDDHYPLEIKNTQKKLDWKPKHNIKDVLPEIIQNFKTNPKKFYLENKLPLPKSMLGTPAYEKVIDLDAIPEPWNKNPSAWSQRIPICILAGIAVVIAVYMGLYQLDLISGVWDPIFGDSTQKVLKSDVSHQMSRWFRIPDALFGALAYLGDILFALAGSTRRWQYRPWIVILFGIDVIPLGIVSIILVFMQAFVVGYWCFLCLVTALISLILILMAYDEVWSSLLFLGRVWKKTKSPKIFWKAFWGLASNEAHEVGEAMIRRA